MHTQSFRDVIKNVFISMQPPPMPPPKKKKTGRNVGIGCGVAAIIVVFFIVIAAAASGTQNNSSSSTSTNTSQVQTANTPAPTTTQASTPKPTPTDTPVPTASASQIETAYKAVTTDTTIAALDKNGNSDQGKDVHFTCTILNFVKDSSGNTAGATVDDPNTSGVVQIAFPANTDLSRLNTGDTLEVWGSDGGTQSGQNAFGATVQEVVVSANYMTDKTTNYQANG
jgi:cytoskeletal protein RodZ